MGAWQVVTIEQICTTFSGGTPSTSHPDYYGGEIPWIASGDLNRCRIDSVEGRITKLGLERSSAKLVKSGTPLIALYGATAGMPAITNIDAAINQAILALVPKSVDSEFLYQWLNANRAMIIERYTQGGQPNLSGELVRKVEVLLPDLEEQRTIGGVLRDLDDLIAALDALIAKKRAVKQGMMQELLTGRTRLPGFEEPWRLIRLGDHVSYVKNVALSRAQLDSSSPLRYLHYGDIHTRPASVLDASVDDMPRAPRLLARNAGLLQVGDLVFADASEDPDGVGKSVEITGVPIGGVIPGLHTIAARFDKGVLADGFKGYLQFIAAFRTQLLALAAGTKVLAITRAYISRIELSLPDVAEQVAIAEVLHDADAEIGALESRLEKTRTVRHGMMQELLTGRTRLPVAAAP
jgi:type I restriction enzyme S subunit